MGNIWCIGQNINSTIGNSVVLTSTDGVVWNDISAGIYPFSGTETGTSLAWSNGFLVAGSDRGDVGITSDYHTWTTNSIGVTGFSVSTMISPPTYMACGRRYYLKAGNGYNIGAEVAQIFKSNTGFPGSYNIVYSSSVLNSGLYGMKYFPSADIGNGISSSVVVAVGQKNNLPLLIYSLDGGLSWVEVSIISSFTDSFYDIEYNLTTKEWYFGTKNTIAIASNLLSPAWKTTISFGTTLSEVTKLSFNPEGNMVAVTPAALWWTDNFENWNKFSSPGYNWQSIIWYNNKWIAGTYSLLKHYTFWYSFDTRNWFPENNMVQAKSFTVSLGSDIRYWLNILGNPGQNYANAMDTDENGNNYPVGFTQNVGTTNYSLAKYDSLGNLKWQIETDNSANISASCVSLDITNSNLFVGGEVIVTEPGSDTGSIVAKYDVNGALLWATQIGNTNINYVQTVVVDNLNNAYYGGISNGNNGSIFKYSPTGSLLWQNKISDVNSNINISSLHATSNASIFACGTIQPNNTNSKIYLSKFNSSGGITWQTSFDGDGDEVAIDLDVDNSGNIYVAGSSNSYINGTSAFLAKFNNNGNLIWRRILSGNGSGDVFSSVITDNTYVYTTGYTNSEGAGGNDILIAKYSKDGNLIWQRSLGGSGSNDEGTSIRIDNALNIYISGTTNSIGGGNRYMVAKLPNDGSLTGAYAEFLYSNSTLSNISNVQLLENPITLSISTDNLEIKNISVSNSSTSFTNITYILS